MIKISNNEDKKKIAIDTLRKEWDLLKTSGLLFQIACSAGPQVMRREGKKPIYNMLKWNATMKGPKNTPYEGYFFKFEITYPETYPDNAPTVTCKTKIYHMNIATDGDVCVSSITKKEGWVKAGDISSVLLSIFVILGRPNTDSPYRDKLAEQYIKNQKEYEDNAREECRKYATQIS